MAKSCVKSSLKLLNSAMGLGGIATIMYGVLMFRIWPPEGESSCSDHHITIPWFFHAFLGVGIALCAITCLGHIAATTANIYGLSTYIIILLLLLILETLIMADAFVNPNWKKELPVNLSDRFDDFMDIVGSYDYIWKWAAWLIFLIQAICVLLATLRIHVANEDDSHESEGESEDDDAQPTLPLLGPSARRQPDDVNVPNIV